MVPECVYYKYLYLCLQDLPENIQVGGRISPQTVWDYVEKIRASGTKVGMFIILFLHSKYGHLYFCLTVNFLCHFRKYVLSGSPPTQRRTRSRMLCYTPISAAVGDTALLLTIVNRLKTCISFPLAPQKKYPTRLFHLTAQVRLFPQVLQVDM